MKKTIIILLQKDEKNGNMLTHEIIGDKLTIPMAQALIDEGLKASGADLVIDLKLKK